MKCGSSPIHWPNPKLGLLRNAFAQEFVQVHTHSHLPSLLCYRRWSKKHITRGHLLLPQILKQFRKADLLNTEVSRTSSTGHGL